MKRRANGEGSLFKRKDGRWSAQTYVTLPNGNRKRICITRKDREDVRTKLREILKNENRLIPYAEKDWTVAEYLDYWMENIQKNRIRETTQEIYEMVIRCHIKPIWGNQKLKGLNVYSVRSGIDELLERGCSARTVQKSLSTLSTCLNCAMREELIFRNVAQLVEKPKHIPKETVIWTAKQAALFLREVRDHPQYIAFLLLLVYGLRRGEALGLRWCDIDFDNGIIHVRQQIGQVKGVIKARELKTENSRRNLPLLSHVHDVLIKLAEERGVVLPQYDPYARLSKNGTIVLSEAGTPLEPRNLYRCFNILRKKVGLPRIKIHAMRHTAATVLKDLNVPVKDVQMILGHSDIATTLNIYQHGTPETHRDAISAVERRLLQGSVENKKDSNLDSSYGARLCLLVSDNKH